MGKTYWLIFISVTALASGLVWHYAPTLGKKLPPAVRTRICETFADLHNRIDIVQTGFSEHLGKNAKPSHATVNAGNEVADVEAPIAVPARTPSVIAKQQPPTATHAQTPTTTQKQTPTATHEQTPIATHTQTPTATHEQTPTTTQKPSSPTQTVEESPYDKGIVRVGPSASSGAKWCVLSHVTPVRSELNGERIGAIAGGRFFLIERRENVDGELMLVGNFTPKKLTNTVQIAAKDVICLTGSPDDLSEKQRECLCMYYQLSGEAETLKTQLMIKESQKNPYAVEAAKALSKLRAKEEKARKNANDADSNRNATYDIAPLAEKVRKLNKKAKEWKEAHAAELSDPEKDPAYLKIIKQRKQYAEEIPGLAF